VYLNQHLCCTCWYSRTQWVGKTTPARVIAGLIAPSSGMVRINDQNLAKDRRVALTEVGILFQNPDHQIIFPTVHEAISFGLRQLGNSKECATEKTRATLASFGKPSSRSSQPIVLKNSVLGLAGEFCSRTTQPDFLGERFVQM
jgi:energy-coupling factor transporter ATP-binding protein EcfA2